MLLYIWLCKNIDLLCWAYKKFNSFLSFHSPVFYSKIHKRRGKFFERGEGVNSLKRTYVEKEVHVKRTETNKGEGGAKIGNFEQTYFFNAPLLKSEIFTAVFMFLMVKSFKKWLEMKKHFFLHMCYWYSFETFLVEQQHRFVTYNAPVFQNLLSAIETRSICFLQRQRCIQNTAIQLRWSFLQI